MASVNKVILIGNVGKDPEVRYNPDGQTMALVSLATTRKWKNREGAQQAETEWSRVVFFGRIAEIAGEYLKKGSQAYVEGYLKTRKWKDKQDVDHYTTEIVATSLQLLSKKEGGTSEPKPAPKPEKPESKKQGHFDDMDDDIPF